MADKDRVTANDGWTVLQKGYTPAKQSVQGGFTPATGSLGTPPTTGTAVTKPAAPKKD
jgi:hypothetical protein